MCLIIAKPFGVAMPTEDEIKNSFDSNSDGFGMAWREHGSPEVNIWKGGMTIAKSLQMIASLENPLELEVLLHFRQATQGAVNKSNCHPYPLTSNYNLLRSKKTCTNMAVTHNGSISDYTKDIKIWEDGKFKTTGDQKFTDTQMFIKEYLSEIGKKLLVNVNPIIRLVEKATNSRFALLSSAGFTLIGSFHEHNGLRCSGYSYVPLLAKTTPYALTKSNFNNTIPYESIHLEYPRQIDCAYGKYRFDMKLYLSAQTCSNCQTQTILLGWLYGVRLCWKCRILACKWEKTGELESNIVEIKKDFYANDSCWYGYC